MLTPSPFLPLSLCSFSIPFLFLFLLLFSLNSTCSLPPSPLHPPSPLSPLPSSHRHLHLHLHFLPFISSSPFPLLPFLPYLLPPSPFSLLLPSLSSLPLSPSHRYMHHHMKAYYPLPESRQQASSQPFHASNPSDLRSPQQNEQRGMPLYEELDVNGSLQRAFPPVRS